MFSSNGPSLGIGGKGRMLTAMSVNPGDSVQLRMGFSNSNVTMYVHDCTTDTSSQTSYDAFGAGDFVPTSNYPTNNHGFFTGLMTEQYHSGPYYGDEKQATYSEAGLWLSTGRRLVE